MTGQRWLLSPQLVGYPTDHPFAYYVTAYPRPFPPAGAFLLVHVAVRSCIRKSKLIQGQISNRRLSSELEDAFDPPLDAAEENFPPIYGNDTAYDQYLRYEANTNEVQGIPFGVQYEEHTVEVQISQDEGGSDSDRNDEADDLPAESTERDKFGFVSHSRRVSLVVTHARSQSDGRGGMCWPNVKVQLSPDLDNVELL
jgi:hypothetical protein